MEKELQLCIMRNVRKILNSREIEIVKFEQECIHHGRGYLARFSRKNVKDGTLERNLTEKGLQELADALNVSKERLMTDTEKYEEDEMRLIDFIHKLLERTEAGKLLWTTVSYDWIKENGEDFVDCEPIGGISSFTRLDPEYSGEEGEMIAFGVDLFDQVALRFNEGHPSLNLDKVIEGKHYSDVWYNNDFYFASIKETGDTLYLYSVEYIDNSDEKKHYPAFELYYTDVKKRSHYLFGSTNWSKYLAELFCKLYELVAKKTSDRRLSVETREFLNRFESI